MFWIASIVRGSVNRGAGISSICRFDSSELAFSGNDHRWWPPAR
jgi:hypothetical protein